MKLPIYQVDAFAGRLFGGNPAAVILLDAWLPDSLMQSIALENNLSETAFVIPRDSVSELRWFTPTTEVDLCGHATLAAGYILFSYRFPDQTQLEFQTRSGILGVHRNSETFSLDFPALPPSPVVETRVKDALGVQPREILKSNSLFAVFESEDEILAIRPDFARIAALGAWMVIATAPGKSVDYVFRVFAPGAGIPEDPATGSAQCTLVPYWADRLGKSAFKSTQLSSRVGEFLCELRGTRISISGRAVEYLRGEIHVG